MASIAQELSALRGQWTVTERTVTIALALTSYPLCGADPQRFALIFASTFTGSLSDGLWLTTLGGQTTTGSLFVANQDEAFILSYRQLGGLVQIPWYAWAPSGSDAEFNVMEIATVSGNFDM